MCLKINELFLVLTTKIDNQKRIKNHEKRISNHKNRKIFAATICR